MLERNARQVMAVVAVIAVAAAAFGASPRPAAAATQGCGDVPEEITGLISMPEPPGITGPVVTGAAPLTVAIAIAGGVVVFPADLLSATFDWGDGGSSAIAASPCGDGETAYWPAQLLRHTYAAVGQYEITWRIRLEGMAFDVPLASVSVQAPAATPTATTAPPTPTPSPEPATPTPTAGAPLATSTPAPAATETPEQPTAAVTAAPTASATPTFTPTVAPTATPGTTATPSPTPTPPPIAAATDSGGAGEDSGGRPEFARAVDDAGEISTDPEVAATNVVLAGVTVWVLFTSVLLNQVLQDNRATLDARTAALAAPVRRLRRRTGNPGASARRRAIGVAAPLLVLVVTGLIYSLLEPTFGWNQPTAVLFGSVIVGVGIVTYICSGLEALATRRVLRAGAAVRAFPACIAIAAVSVAISRALGLQPGVMYGMVASCAVLGPVAASGEQKGRIAIVPVLATLALSVAAWLAIGPVRSLESGSLARDGAEATLAVVFVGGLEGLLLGMLPIAATDGGKIFGWNRLAWFVLAGVAAFLAWHVLLGREQAYFSGLRQADSLAMVGLFAAYSVATVAAWAYFRSRHEPVPA